jgi:hypothetical protein
MRSEVVFEVVAVMFAQWPVAPRHHPLSDEYRGEWEQSYRNWTPGPKGAAAVKRLDDRADDLRGQLAR